MAHAAAEPGAVTGTGAGTGAGTIASSSPGTALEPPFSPNGAGFGQKLADSIATPLYPCAHCGPTIGELSVVPPDHCKINFDDVVAHCPSIRVFSVRNSARRDLT